jgi:alpha-mannosidase
MYGPAAEAALVARIAAGRFDVGGTFSEGFESTMVNEVLARQMYVGRKWFVERYPALDSAVVAFHQDGPLRAIQMPQVYAKAGMRYMKPSRLAEDIILWGGLDGASGLIAFPQWQYCEGATQWATSAQDVLYRMALYAPQYEAYGLAPVLPVTWGCDYAPPDNATQLFADWAALSTGGANVPELVYSNFKLWGDAINVSRAQLPVVVGERPNLWFIENSPTHHYMWSNYRDAGRLLPAAEAFAAFRCVLEGAFDSYPVDILDAAWLNISLADHGISAEPVPKGQGLPSWLLNDASPDFADQVYAQKWEMARAAADSMLSEAQTWLAGQVNVSDQPPGSLASVTVFNSLSWSRSDVVLDLAKPAGAGSLSVVTAGGALVNSQLSADGSTVIFVADEVPSFGYKTFFLVPAATAPQAATAAPSLAGTPWTSQWSNAFFQLTPGAGGLHSVVDLASGASLFDTTHYDVGEWMELQYTGMGASETHEYAAPWLNVSTFARLGNLPGQLISWTVVEDGPARVVFQTAPMRTAHSTVTLVVEAYSAVKRLDLRVKIAAWDSAFGVVNRVVLPVNTQMRNLSYAAPFGVVRVGLDEAEAGFRDMWLLNPAANVGSFERGWAMRPREIGDWMRVECSDAVGVTISSSVGAFDWTDPTGAYPSYQPVLAPEMLLHTNSNRSPFLPEPGDHDFLFSITASPPGWQSGWRSGVQANNPLRSVTRTLPAAAAGATATAAPPLPLSAAFLTVSSAAGRGDDVEAWVTAVKKQDGEGRRGLVARLFAVSDADIEGGVRIESPWPLVGGAQHTNLIELDARDVPGVAANDTSFDAPLGRWSIETFRLGVLG